jgi:hypothetical protein
MHGKGHYTWGDGRSYEGEYSHDKKHGQGVYIWNDDRKYDGQWAYGKQHGRGKYILKDGSYKVGLWENGKRIKWIDEKDTTTVAPAVDPSLNDKSASPSANIPNSKTPVQGDQSNYQTPQNVQQDIDNMLEKMSSPEKLPQSTQNAQVKSSAPVPSDINSASHNQELTSQNSSQSLSNPSPNPLADPKSPYDLSKSNPAQNPSINQPSSQNLISPVNSQPQSQEPKPSVQPANNSPSSGVHPVDPKLDLQSPLTQQKTDSEIPKSPTDISKTAQDPVKAEGEKDKVAGINVKETTEAIKQSTEQVKQSDVSPKSSSGPVQQDLSKNSEKVELSKAPITPITENNQSSIASDKAQPTNSEHKSDTNDKLVEGVKQEKVEVHEEKA